MTPDDGRDQQPGRINRRRVVLILLGMLFFFALFLFLPAGNVAWAKGGCSSW
jgi:hypothetical protein